jgi:cell division protein FtsW (lipid II flippase)
MAESGDSPYLEACPQCGCRDLFLRKAFPQKLGLAIVITAAVAFLVLAASRATLWIGVLVLLAAAVVDLLLYMVVPKITVCYRCRAEFRDVPVNPQHEGYDLATGEKYRQH